MLLDINILTFKYLFFYSGNFLSYEVDGSVDIIRAEDSESSSSDTMVRVHSIPYSAELPLGSPDDGSDETVDEFLGDPTVGEEDESGDDSSDDGMRNWWVFWLLALICGVILLIFMTKSSDTGTAVEIS